MKKENLNISKNTTTMKFNNQTTLIRGQDNNQNDIQQKLPMDDLKTIEQTQKYNHLRFSE